MHINDASHVESTCQQPRGVEVFLHPSQKQGPPAAQRDVAISADCPFVLILDAFIQHLESVRSEIVAGFSLFFHDGM